MGYNKMADIPPLKAFAALGNFDNKLIFLAEQLAEKEDWYYENPNSKDKQKKYGVLFQYIHHTFSKSFDEDRLLIKENECVMNTGLLTVNGEEIFMLFTKNKRTGEQPWFFESFYRSSDHKIPESMRGDLPSHIDYFEDNPEDMYFDTKLTILYNMDHIVRDNYDRLPVSLQQLDHSLIVTILNASTEQMKQRILRNNRLVVPQYYNKKIMYLAPLKFGNETLPLAIEKHQHSYRINTILTPGMAYCNARLIMKPESNWLNNH
ncbi:DUF3825 domain-containing protein [Enterococcus sp. DIV0086]|uniref:DUF3825 domain-containing protein n=2 Tax=Enterococcus sp. DIV0086 TaxID=2774655 RepID=UPI003D2A3DD3